MKYDLDGVCQDCMYLEKIKLLFEQLQQKNQQLKIQISAREEEYRKLEDKLVETENWLRPAILQLMKIAKKDYFWITNQQIDNAELVPLTFTVMGDKSVKFEKLERGVSDVKDLLKENEELKKELQKANDTLDTHNELIEHLKKELNELTNEPFTNRFSRIDSVLANIYTLNKNQQQEFIKYLEDEIHTIETTYSQINGNYGLMNEKLETLKEILQKYKGIIGIDINVGSKGVKDGQ